MFAESCKTPSPQTLGSIKSDGQVDDSNSNSVKYDRAYFIM